MKTVDISRWRQIGKGGNGVVYESLDDPDVILKLDLWGRKEKMQHEFECARRAAELGVHTPEVYEMATDGKRYGYTCKRIRGKKSYCRVIADEPARLDEMARRFAQHSRELHSIECDTEFFPSYVDGVRQFLQESEFLKPETSDRLYEMVTSIPASTHCLHGDFHFGNIITSGDDDWWIDLERFRYGNPVCDFGPFYFTTRYLPGFVTKYIYHLSKSLALEFFKKSVEYYFAPETDAERSEIYRQLEIVSTICYAGIIQHWMLAIMFMPCLQKRLGQKPMSRLRIAWNLLRGNKRLC